MSRAYIERFAGEAMRKPDVSAALAWLGGSALIPSAARVFVKPNLTWASPIDGVTTTPSGIEAVVAALRDYTPNIIVGESDGGYHAYKAEEAFQGHGLFDLVDRYGIQVRNLTKEPAEEVETEIAGRRVTVTLPKLLLHETDLFISLPVPKIHVMTKVTLAFKNLWGCIPSPMRLREHAEFDHKILAISQLVAPAIAIFDGTFFLDKTGPVFGETIPMNLLIAGDDLGGASAVCCSVMGIDPGTVRHFRLARKCGWFPASLADVQVNQPPEPFRTRTFTMHRAFLDYLSLVGFRSKLFTAFFWDSAFADPLHKLLYTARRNPVICKFLYGPSGSPPEPQPHSETATE
jgi:uncharacterized protein (DUF362 family)